MLVGNKCDMDDKRAVSYEEGEALGNFSLIFLKQNSLNCNLLKHLQNYQRI